MITVSTEADIISVAERETPRHVTSRHVDTSLDVETSPRHEGCPALENRNTGATTDSADCPDPLDSDNLPQTSGEKGAGEGMVLENACLLVQTKEFEIILTRLGEGGDCRACFCSGFRFGMFREMFHSHSHDSDREQTG